MHGARRYSPLGIFVLCLTMFSLARGCTPECPYDTRCNGNVLESCTIGVDQCVGPQDMGQRTCEGLNPVCVTLDERTAMCASDETPCEMERCDGDVVHNCQSGHDVATDCAESGCACQERDGVASCAC